MFLYLKWSVKQLIMLLVLFAIGCVITNCSYLKLTTISPIVPRGTFGSPAKILDHYRRFTAAQSFPQAYETAKNWHRDAEWYGIVPFTSIERAFAIPLSDNNPSWFFRFGVLRENRELIVEVFNGIIKGVNETTLPVYIEPSLQEIEPLGDKWTIMDSTAVLEKCFADNNLLAQFPHLLIDYRLVKPKSYTHPIWVLYNAQNLSKPLCAIDAVTGEISPVDTP